VVLVAQAPDQRSAKFKIRSALGQAPLPGLLQPVSAAAESVDVSLMAQLRSIQSAMQGKVLTVSLRDALSRGLAASPQLAVSYRSIQQQQWQLIAARRDWYPNLSVSARPLWGYQYNTTISNYQPYANSALNTAFGIPITTWQGSYTTASQVSPSTTLTWTFLKPQRTSAINSQLELLKQQRYLYAVSARSLILQIQQNYYMLQSLKDLIRAYVNLSVTNLEEVKVMEERFQTRLVTVSDLEQSRTQALNQMYQLIDFVNQYQATSAALANLLGLETTTLLDPSDGFGQLQDWSLSLDQTVAQALSLREEVKANLAAAQSYDWDAKALIQQYLPNLFLFASATANQGSGTFNGDLSGMTQGPANGSIWNPGASLGIGLTWQLFDGGIYAAQSSARKALAQQQLDQAQQTRLDISQQIKTAYAAYRNQRLAIQTSTLAVQSALKAQAAAQARYRVGIGDITTLVQATGLYGNALFNLSNAQMSYYTALASLYRYSAIWPPGTDALVEQRSLQLR
jgi:outer membrane protein TolC